MIKIPITSKTFKLRKYKPRMEVFKDRIEKAFKELSEMYIKQNINNKSNITETKARKKSIIKTDNNNNQKAKKYKLLKNEKLKEEKKEKGNSSQKILEIKNKIEENKNNEDTNEENPKIYIDKLETNNEVPNVDGDNDENNSKNIENENEQKDNKEDETLNNNEKDLKDEENDSNNNNESEKEKQDEKNEEKSQNDKDSATNEENKSEKKESNNDSNITQQNSKNNFYENKNNIETEKEESIQSNEDNNKDNKEEIILPFIYKIKTIFNKLSEIKNNSNISEEDIKNEVLLLSQRSLTELSLVKYKLNKKYENLERLYEIQSKELSKKIEENIVQKNIIEKYKKIEFEKNLTIKYLQNEIKTLKTKLYDNFLEIQNYKQKMQKNLELKTPRMSLNDNIKKILYGKEQSLKRTNSDYLKLKEENQNENGISNYKDKKLKYSQSLSKINISNNNFQSNGMNTSNKNINNNESQMNINDYFNKGISIRPAQYQRNKFNRYKNYSAIDYETLNIASGYKRFEIKNSSNLGNLNSLFINSSRKLTPLKIKNTNKANNNVENN